MKVVVTGAAGFIGKNLSVALGRLPGLSVHGLDKESMAQDWEAALASADFVYHLAGVNRPEREEDFFAGNAELTERLCLALSEQESPPAIVLASSIHAIQDTGYGRSKRHAENAAGEYGRRTGAPVYLFRLPGVFGKWCRPDYNSVVANFCHRIAREMPITISNAAREIDLVYIDDVVRAFLHLLEGGEATKGSEFYEVEPRYRVALGNLADMLRSFRDIRSSLRLPDMADTFARALYATYLSYLPPDGFAYALPRREDSRGVLAEAIKSPHCGQIFVSRTRSGVTRGGHYHDSKVEKFLILEGEAVVRFWHVLGGDLIEYRVVGTELRVMDIPPGYTHEIENVGQGELVVMFWANEIFDAASPDTHALPLQDRRTGSL